jgi:hypothetical protein
MRGELVWAKLGPVMRHIMRCVMRRILRRLGWQTWLLAKLLDLSDIAVGNVGVPTC